MLKANLSTNFFEFSSFSYPSQNVYSFLICCLEGSLEVRDHWSSEEPFQSSELFFRFCMIYHMNKPIKLATEEPPPPPPQRFDSLAAMTSPGGTSRGPPPDLTSQISEIDIT